LQSGFVDKHEEGRGSEKQFRKVHDMVSATSPNRFNVANAIRLKSKPVLENR
jgi:hypothetical protein